MVQIIIGIVSLMRTVLIDLPPKLLALIASLWMALILFLHRRRRSRSGATGAQAAVRILAAHRLQTNVQGVRGWLVDCYLPRQDTIALSEGVFHGTSIGVLGIAAHEVGHALQARRWFAPWCARRLLVLPANLGLTLCLWVWLTGMILRDQRIVLAGIACFGPYLLFLLCELVCEADASRRGVHELVRHGLLDREESRIARRILRSALATYVAAFVGSAAALTFLLCSLDWPVLLDQLPLLQQQMKLLLPGN